MGSDLEKYTRRDKKLAQQIKVGDEKALKARDRGLEIINGATMLGGGITFILSISFLVTYIETIENDGLLNWPPSLPVGVVVGLALIAAICYWINIWAIDKSIFIDDQIEVIQDQPFKIEKIVTNKGLEIRLVEKSDEKGLVIESKLFNSDTSEDVIAASNYLVYLESLKSEKTESIAKLKEKQQEAEKREMDNVYAARQKATQLKQLLP